MRCRYNAVNFHPNPHRRKPHSSPARAGYGVTFVNITSDAGYVSVIVVQMQNHVMLGRVITERYEYKPDLNQWLLTHWLEYNVHILQVVKQIRSLKLFDTNYRRVNHAQRQILYGHIITQILLQEFIEHLCIIQFQTGHPAPVCAFSIKLLTDDTATAGDQHLCLLWYGSFVGIANTSHGVAIRMLIKSFRTGLGATNAILG